MLKVIDVSRHDQMKTDPLPDVDAIICKATEGGAWMDPVFHDRFQALEHAGKLKGAYHFLRAGKVDAQVEWFIRVTGVYADSFIPIVDWETGVDGIMPSVDECKRFCEVYRERTGVPPWVYASRSVLEPFVNGAVFKDNGLWVAQYPPITSPTFEDAMNSLEMPWFADCWQFCSDGQVEGVNLGMAATDCSIFRGDEKAWRSYCLGRPAEDAKPEPKRTLLWENGKYRLILEEC